MSADKYVIPSHLDDPELIGIWTLDEFLAMVIPFIWGYCPNTLSSGSAWPSWDGGLSGEQKRDGQRRG
jgi:conjugal transfer pilus assembly protein TraL